MDYAFCPQAIVWGDVAVWFTGFGSVAAAVTAVGIAIYIDRRQERRALELDRQQAQRADVDRNRDAQAMSIGLHGELTAACGVVAVLAHIDSEIKPQNPDINVQEMSVMLGGRLMVPLLERFSNALGRFDAPVAGHLAICLGGISSLKQACRPAVIGAQPISDERAGRALQRTEAMARVLLLRLYDTLDLLAPIAAAAGFKVLEVNIIRAQCEAPTPPGFWKI